MAEMSPANDVVEARAAAVPSEQPKSAKAEESQMAGASPVQSDDKPRSSEAAPKVGGAKGDVSEPSPVEPSNAKEESRPPSVEKSNEENVAPQNGNVASEPPRVDANVQASPGQPRPPPPAGRPEEAKVAQSDGNVSAPQSSHPNAEDDIDWVEKRKMDLLTQQADRTTLLHRQKQVIMASADKDRKNLQKCQGRFDAMVERLDTARQTAQELYEYLSSRQKTATRAAADSKSPQQTVFGSRESGTIRQAAVAQDHFALNLSEQQKEMNDRVFTPAIIRCLQFTKDTKQRLNYLKTEGNKVARTLDESKLSLDKAWASYELSMSKSVHLASQGKRMDADPFLVAREYQMASAGYKRVEEVYSVSMSKLFREVATADGRRIDEMKAILLDWFLAEKALAQNRSKLIDTALSYIKGIDREKDVNSFIKNGEFVMGPKNQTVFEALPKGLGTQEISDLFYRDILKHGELYRQGRLIASNWKKMFAIITRSGFFHCYDSKAASLPLFSIRLDCVNVVLKESMGANVFEVAVPNQSIFSLTGNPTRYLFKADNEEIMVDWITEINKHLAE